MPTAARGRAATTTRRCCVRRHVSLLLLIAIRCTSCGRLHDAATANDVKTIQQCLDAGDHLDELNAAGDTAVLVAVRSWQQRALHLLIRRGASVRLGDKDGYAPLHVAAMLGNAEAAERLVLAGAPVSEMHPDGYTPLHRAARGSEAVHTATMRVLVSLGADPSEPTFPPYELDMRHKKPLELASRAESRASLEASLAEGWRGELPFWRHARGAATPAQFAEPPLDEVVDEAASGEEGSGSGYYEEEQSTTGSGGDVVGSDGSGDLGSGSEDESGTG